jgi:hypothetical protein
MVLHKAFLFPLDNRARLVKLTERRSSAGDLRRQLRGQSPSSVGYPLSGY